MAVKGTLIKIRNPEEGVSREEYEAICAALAIRPKPQGPQAVADSSA